MCIRDSDKFFDLAIVDPQYGIDIMHKGGMPKHLGFKQYKRCLLYTSRCV